jgi:hypothetical protein
LTQILGSRDLLIEFFESAQICENLRMTC